jgi:capsular exopolysaccharide synthesis family protein
MTNVAAPSRMSAPRAHAVVPASDAVSAVAEQLVSLIEPTSIAADQYRALRYSVETLRKESGVHLLGVTSPCPGDGKTVTTLNLAGALAQARDARVLVVDADLRKPSVASYLGLSDRRLPGLGHALRDPALELADVVHHIERFNLSVVPAGPPNAAPYELLHSSRLDVLLAEARRDYDCVLIDTPPAVLLPDCRVIERSVDGFLIVVAARKTTRKMVTEALNQIDADKVLGFVFNADDRPAARDHGYYGYYNTGTAQSSPRAGRLWRRLLETR